MAVDVDPYWALAVMLVAMRLGVLMLASPVFGGLGSLVTVRVLLGFALAFVLVSGGGLRPAVRDLGAGAVLVAAAGEVVVGMTLAFGVSAAFGAFSLAGKVLDLQSGFGMGSVYDPVTRSEAPLFASMLNLVGVTVFFAVDAHHALLRGIAYSLAKVPPGAGLSLDPEAALAQFGIIFALGVAVIIPVMLCMLLIETALAVTSRVLPQMNVFVVSVPVKIAACVGMFALAVPMTAPVMDKIYASIFTYWERVLG